MKKLSIFAVAFATIVFASCGNKSAQNAESADSVKTFEQEQIEASIKMHLDSIASEISKLEMVPFLQEGDNGLELTKEELLVKPDYLLDPAIAEDAITLAEKYRLLSALDVNRKVARIYEMPTEEYDKAIAKLAADINDPSFEAIQDSASFAEATKALYDAMNENGRINNYWQMAAASIIEQIFMAEQNPDKYLATFTDETAANTTFRLICVLDALDRLSAYDPDIQPIVEAVAPLKSIDALTVEELKTQLAAAKEKIIAARKSLVG